MWKVWTASRHRSGLADCALALGAVALALLGLGLLGDVLGTSAPFILTFSVLLPLALLMRPIAVVVAALAGWLGSWFFFIEPRHSFGTDTVADAVLVAVFGLAVVLVSVAAGVAASTQASRRRAEEALARSEAQFRRLADTIPQLAWYANPDGSITWFNRRWYEYTGSTPAEMEGWGWQRVHDPDVLPLVRERWTASLASGEPFDMAFPLRGADGTFRPFLTRVMPLRDEQGRVVQWFGTNTDISDQKRIEDTLREREERYRSLFEGNPHPMWVYDLETLRFLAVNDAAVAHYGYSRDEFLSMTLADIRPAADVPRPLEQAYAESPALRWRGVGRHLTRAGREIEVETTVHRLEFDGRPGALVLAHDITERQRAETALRESEARFRRLADALPQMVWSADPDGAVTFFNRQWFQFTGADAPGSLGEGWVQVVHPDDRARSLARWREAVAIGRPYEDELRYKRADGTYRWFLARALPLGDGDGRAKEWFGTCTDIEDQQHAVEALRAADRRKDAFIATLAHELRNPLAPIRMAVGILRRSPDDPPRVARMLDTIERQSSHLVRLIDDLLDVSRITRGRIELQRERVDLAAVVGQAVESTRPLLDAGRFDLDVRLPAAPVLVDADPVRLAQIIGNLLDNACKYTSRGGRVTLDAAREGDAVVVRVRDTGAGIATDQLARIFEMFTQGDAPPWQAPGGLGIGLSLARSLVELHGGTIEARSEGPGLGSEFIVRLPAAEPDAPAASDAPAVRAAVVPRRRILAVDDNRDALDTLAALLRLEGHDVRTAGDGQDALRLAASWRPDVVLLDIGMPVLDGYEVARRLRREPWGRAITLVALTGWGQPQDRRRSADAGFDAHLTKPASVEALDAVLAHPGRRDAS